ncbi:hypothetical protein D9M70_238170 [compost metagenome]
MFNTYHKDQQGIKTLCLLYTTYHSFLWDTISREINQPNITIINFSKRPLKIKSSANKTIERSRETKISFLIKCLKIASKAKFSPYNLFIPHPDHLLGNTLFFNKNAKNITIIEDGILNYYDYEASAEIKKTSKKRRLITYLTPFRYNTYTGHHSGIDSVPPRYLSGWFSNPEKIIKKENYSKINKIKFPEQKSKDHELYEKAVFLDQPIEKFLPPSKAKALRESSIAFLEKSFQEVTVKAHPEHDQETLPIKNRSIYIFPPNTPIEEIICETQPIAIISYCSTALINSALISPRTRCISIGINIITEEIPTTSSIRNLFKEVGVEII